MSVVITLSDLERRDVRYQLLQVISVHIVAPFDARVVRIDLLHFLDGCRKTRLNQAVTVLSLSLTFLNVSVVLLTRATFRIV